MTKQLKVYVASDDPMFAAIQAAILTLPARYSLVQSAAEAEVSAQELLPAGTPASWAAAYFKDAADIDEASLSGQTIEVSIDSPIWLTTDARLEECLSVLASLGVASLEDRADTAASNSVLSAGYYQGSLVTAAHCTVAAESAALSVSFTDANRRITLQAPLGHTAKPIEIAVHSATGIHISRPVYQSVIARLLSN